MKKIFSFLLSVVIMLWLVIAIFVTVCLLSYNDFKVATFGKNSLLIMDSDELEPTFMEGDLLVVKRNSDSKINVGDDIFFYNSAKNTATLVYHGKVTKKEKVNSEETTYIVNDKKISGEFVIGKFNGVKIFRGVGAVLALFTSKWGFMFLVIFPTLFAIIYEIIMIMESARNLKEDNKE